MELLKKGLKTKRNKYRGLLISDHMGKAAAWVLDAEVERTSEKQFLPNTQCGGVPGKGSDIANHLVRTAYDFAAGNGLSIALVFLDLIKAFDYVLREIVIGWPQYHSEDKVEYLTSLGLSDQHASELAKEIDECGAVFERSRVHPHIQALVSSIHTNSWFSIVESESALLVRKGGRQGCRFGSKLFNLAYAVPLKVWAAEMCELGIILNIRRTSGSPDVGFSWAGVSSFTHARQQTQGQEGTEIIDVEFIDDAAFVLTASVPSISVLISALLYHGCLIFCTGTA